ncbi:hypothetical protein [Winogradskyella immobilis]|uniref:Uncharacterized protein n=1 Tax=Winogradskyella immobilis TaxID=2816852 RepID=A0ABS8ERD5_9FLAO|nr:hypothetical protein [Winogradskyella immobilis]MCC1485670.1 hypothetical protein [Winogradskyella immobilis]MCG0017764.1 hypothetical protein [Winogradskyella immobilis]
MRKTFYFLIIILLISNLSFGQERNAKPKPEISNSIIGQLTSAKGWVLNPEEEWQSLTNTIPAYLSSEFKQLINYEKYSLGSDNFKSYQLRDLTFKGEEYYILIKKYKDGFYTYSSIEEDWNNYTSYLAYVFKKSEWEKISTIEDNKINLIEIDLETTVSVQYKSEKEAFSLIKSKMEFKDDQKDDTKLILHIAPYKEKNIVQFQIYTKYSKYKIIGGIRTEHKIKGGKYSFSTKQIYLTDELFSHCYFETDFANFNKFIKTE